MQHQDRLITLPWIHILRVFGIILFIFGILASTLGLYAAPAWPVATPVLVLFGVGSLLLGVRPQARPGDGRVAAALGTDILALTTLLAGTEGSGSPYTLLYIFPLVLAGLAVRPPYAWSLFALAAVSYSGLFIFAPANLHHHDESAMRGHLVGMWVTVLLVGALTLFAFGRMRAQMTRIDQRIREARALESRNTRLAALATLAAGAAHELATPLSTILLVARELERSATPGRAREDLALIAEEVMRCQEVLHQLTADAGEGLGERGTPHSLRSLLAEATSPLRDPRIQVEASDDEVQLPARLLGQVVRRLAGNALSASGPAQKVWIRAAVEGHTLRLVVEDAGVGMTAAVLERAGEPFFTTRPHGEGRGLGLYFCRSVVERLGGSFELRSEIGRGTTVTLTVPLEAA